MSLAQNNEIDAVGIETASGDVVLTLADSWDWSDEYKHLMALQSKLNSYFDFVESGQICDTYPLARGRAIRIDVVTRFPVSEAGLQLLDKARAVAKELGIAIEQRQFAGLDLGKRL